MTKYKRILLKLSGEVLMGKKSFGLDNIVVEKIALQIKQVFKLNIEICMVVGGGNIFRGISAASKGVDRSTADYMGMLATLINALSLQNALEKISVQTRVQSAINISQIAEPYIRRRAIRHMEKGRVVIFAGGTGNPYFTTDTAAVLRAIEINADMVLKGTKVDGVYSDDPIKNPNAELYDFLNYKEVINNELRVMDLTAVTLCKENNLPISVFNIQNNKNLSDLLKGKKIGTKIS